MRTRNLTKKQHQILRRLLTQYVQYLQAQAMELSDSIRKQKAAIDHMEKKEKLIELSKELSAL